MGNLLIYSAVEIFCIWPRTLPRFGGVGRDSPRGPLGEYSSIAAAYRRAALMHAAASSATAAVCTRP